MEKTELHPDFKDFLRYLNSHKVDYLLVGGYAVGLYGYPRATGDMDIWVSVLPQNARRLREALIDFGLPTDRITEDMLTEKGKVFRIGSPPVRIEVITGASGVEFEGCHSRRLLVDIEGIPVSFISLEDLKTNKKAAGRHKDLDDLEHLS